METRVKPLLDISAAIQLHRFLNVTVDYLCCKCDLGKTEH